MKHKFLKIAGVKTEAQFYKKYKTEEDFFKAHPEAKKLIPKAVDGQSIISLSDDELNDTSEQSWGNYLAPKTPHKGIEGAIKTFAPMVSDVIGGFQQLGAEQDAVDKAHQQAALSSVQAQAATSKDVDAPNVIRRNNKKRMDAMMQPINPNELFPSYGVGTNVLTKNGGKIKKAKGGAEIQNTYSSPTTLYTDLEYIPKAQDGFSDFMTGSGGNMLTGLASGATGNNAGNKIGGGIGKAAGTIFGGPLGGAIGGVLGTAIGGLFDHSAEDVARWEKENKHSQNKIMGAAFANNIQAQNASYMENGGNLTNPQLITKFGEYDLKDLLVPDPTMNTLRAGGHLHSYTPPSEHAMEQYALGGDVQTHWGGHAEPISQNPYLPDGGETIMFRGNSHDESDGKGRTGIGITFGNNPVEVERGEPAVKLENGGSSDVDLTVYGNLYADMAGKEYKGKKFKNIVSELSKKEQKQNKIINKSSFEIDNNSLSSPFDILAMNSNKMMLMGADSKLKNIADEKMHLAQVQNAINETAAEHGILAEDLAKGKATIDRQAMKEYAKNGKMLKAQKGITFKHGEQRNNGQETWDNTIKSWIPSTTFESKYLINTAGGNNFHPNSFYDDPLPPLTTSPTPQYGFSGSQAPIINQQLRPLIDPVAPEYVTEADLKYAGLANMPTTTGASSSGLSKADYDLLTKLYDEAAKPGASKATVKKFQNTFYEKAPTIAEQIMRTSAPSNLAKEKGYTQADLQKLSLKDLFATNDPTFGSRTKQFKAAIDATQTPYVLPKLTSIMDTPASASKNKTSEVTPIKAKSTIDATPAKSNILGLIASQLNPLFRQPVRNPLDPNQLIGENYALSRNQVEPVQANLYQPQLDTPYDISLQDQLNEITASFNAARRMSGYDPAAQSAIAGQEAMAKQKVLGEQFRLNQAKKDQVFSSNRATLNDAKLKNLGILDQQYVRQNQAKSNAQALTQSALNSISDKIAKNKLETYGMNVYANKYPDYSFDNQGVLRKLPTFQQFDIPTVGSTASSKSSKYSLPEGYDVWSNASGEERVYKTKEDSKAKNGFIVKSFKSL